MSKNTNLSFLTDFLTADIVNSRVGMNNTFPQNTFDVTGTGKFSGVLTLGSTVSNGTYTYTLPSATGTLALTSDIPSVSGYVPYTGATQDVNLGVNTLTSKGLNVDVIAGQGGALNLRQATNISTWNGAPFTSIYATTGNRVVIMFSNDNRQVTLDGSIVSAASPRTFTFPDATGTFALTSQIPANAVGGTGTLNTIPKFTAATTIGNSNIFDSGSIIYNTNPAAGTFAWQFNGSTVTGQSYGAQVIAGTNASDIGFKVMNAAASINYLVVRGDGLVTLTGDLIAASATLNTPANAVGVLLNGRTSDNVSQIRFGANTGGGAYNTIQASPTSFDINSQGNTPITFGTNLGGGGGTRMTILGTGGVTLTGALNGTSASFTGGFELNTTGTGALGFFGANNTTDKYIRIRNSSGNIEMGTSSSEHYLYGQGSIPLKFFTNSTARLTLDASTGAATFSVSGATNNILISQSTISPTYGVISLNGTTTEGNYIGIAGGGGVDKSLYLQSGNGGDLIFRTGNGSSFSTKLTISNTGAAIFSSSNLTLQSSSEAEVRSLSTSTGNYANFIVDTDNTVNHRLQMVGFGSTASGTLAGISRAGNGFVVKSGGLLAIGTRDLNDLVLSTNETERMRITSDGNVLLSSNKNIGINTTDGSDNGYLAISGAGSDGPSRGGHIYLSGNERVADAGTAVISAGNVATGSVIFRTGASTPRMTITSGGSVCINRQDSPYGNFSVKSNSSTSYAGINVYASTSERFIAINHTGAEGVIESEFAGGGFTPLSFKAGGAERMRISDTGAITMSVPTSGQTLTISGKNNNWTQEIVGSTTTGQSYGLLITAGTNSSDYPIYAQNRAGDTVLFRVRGDGVINTGTASGSPYNNTSAQIPNLYVSSGGTLERGTSSSGRFKENIINWDGNGLDTILALKAKTFKYKKDYYNKADIDFLGLIAEDVAQVSPYLADYENEDRTGQVENVRYATIVVPLIKAIQELKAELDELKNKLS